MNRVIVGYEIATRSLLIQDTNTVYDVSSEFNLSDDELSLSVDQAIEMIFWYLMIGIGNRQPKHCGMTFSLVSYSRPISFWKSQAYLGALTLAHPVKNRLFFK